MANDPTTAPLVAHTPESQTMLAGIIAEFVLEEYQEERRRNTREQSKAFHATIERGVQAAHANRLGESL